MNELSRELITNAVKYAYKDRPHGTIWITVGRTGETGFAISVRDQGTGLPAGFDPHNAKGLGMRIITTFAKQLDATLEIHNRDPGTEFVLNIPLRITH